MAKQNKKRPAKIKDFLWKFANKDYSSQDEFELTMKDYSEVYNRTRYKFPNINLDKIHDIVSSLHSVKLQKEMSKSSNRLAIATWVLAISTIIFTMSNLWGEEITNNILEAAFLGIIQGGALLFAAGFALAILIIGSKKILRKILSKEYI